MNEPVRLTLKDVAFFERDVTLRMPFRFGVVTLTEAPQTFVRVQIEAKDGRRGQGVSAELLAPKWFDKDPALTNEQNFDQLRQALAIARDLYLDARGPLTAFGLHAASADEQIRRCGAEDLNPLVAGFGTALLDRAVIDALCRLEGISVFEAVRHNHLGITSATAPDLDRFDLDGFLSTLGPAPTIAARHTVGLVDAITEAELTTDKRVDDGLPETLEACVRHYGLRYFKLKVGGDKMVDIERLRAIASVLGRIEEPYHCTLDGNEQYATAEAVIDLVHAMRAEPALQRLCRSILFLEQPIKRQAALSTGIEPLARLLDVEIDESDATMASFLEARALGYKGVSSKSCKGFYRSLLNRARCAMWNVDDPQAPFFMSAEDLTTQAGIALQQDLALATLIGCRHIERNGHHYVNGMAGAPEAEQRRFLDAHPDLYHRGGGTARLTIEDGRIALGSLEAPGLASAVIPDLNALRARAYGGP